MMKYKLLNDNKVGTFYHNDEMATFRRVTFTLFL